MKEKLRKYFINPKWIVVFLVVALYCIPQVTSLGYVSLDRISITILHIPVILVTMVYGLAEGVIVALFFGISSMNSAGRLSPDSIDYLFTDPRLSIVTRLFLPVVVWITYKIIRWFADDNTKLAHFLCSGFTAMVGSLANTSIVTATLVLLYPSELGLDQGITVDASTFLSSVGDNARNEAVFTVLVVLVATLLRELFTIGDKEKEKKLKNRPIRKTFQKWLFLFMLMTFFLVLAFMNTVLSIAGLGSNKYLFQEKMNDVKKRVMIVDDSIQDKDLVFGQSGVVLISKYGRVYKAGSEEYIGQEVDDLGIAELEKYEGDMRFVNLKESYGVGMYNRIRDKNVYLFMPTSEVFSTRNQIMLILFNGLTIIFLIMFLIISRLLKKNVIEKINVINDSLSRIREGNLDEVVDVSANVEFERLSEGINDTVSALKDTMHAIDEKNKQEKLFAKEIQYSALPNSECFQPENGEYEIWGSMNTAEEVGGDFYDYYMMDENRIGFVIADVSGKGVPAAMFMMTSKTLLKDLILSGASPAEAFEKANAQLAQNNENGMFVTAWLGILDYKNGKMTFANAGHNPPVLKRKGANSEYLDYKRYKRSLMLGFIEGTTYENNEIDISKGDLLFLYTDGVTEAHDKEKNQYGEERLQECIEKNYSLKVADILSAVKQDVDDFSNGAEQFDDITMVGIKLGGEES